MKKLFILFFVFFNASPFLYSQSGSLDISFGFGGKVFTDLGGMIESISSVTTQPDGKILVAGYTKIGGYYNFAIARYNSDGSLDNSFNGDGIVTIAFSAYNCFASRIAIQGDGKIIVAGTTFSYGVGAYDDFAIARLNSDGTLDNSFSGDGKATVVFDMANEGCSSIVLQPDGKIVCVGTAQVPLDHIAIARLNADGTLDNSFSGDGREAFSVGLFDYGLDVNIQNDGKLVIAGLTTDTIGTNFVIVRCETDGSLDSSFDFDGVVIFDFDSIYTYDNKNAASIEFQTDGKILFSGTTVIDSIENFMLCRFNVNGSFDTSFGVNGKVATAIGVGNAQCNDMALLSSGKIILAGTSFNGISNNFTLACYNTVGYLDMSFNFDGIVDTAINIESSSASSITVQADGKIILAGSATFGTNTDFALARYEAPLIGIQENNSISSLKLFPNPTNSSINLEVKKSLINASLRIVDVSGKIMLTKNNLIGNHLSFDVSGFANGIYFMEVKSIEGVEQVKFVKE